MICYMRKKKTTESRVKIKNFDKKTHKKMEKCIQLWFLNRKDEIMLQVLYLRNLSLVFKSS